MSSGESANCSSSDSDSSETSHDERSYRSKTFAERRLRHINYFYDKFGMCQKCQDIYWEMRHTWNDDDGGSFYSFIHMNGMVMKDTKLMKMRRRYSLVTKK